MSLRSRLTKVQKMLGPGLSCPRLAKVEKMLGPGPSCPHCGDHPIATICIYEEKPDGTRHLVSGTPPTPCSVCGRIAADNPISAIVYRHADA